MAQAGQIVRTHGTMVWGTLWRLIGGVGRTADVEDCFQEVFVAALEVQRREEVKNWEAMLRRIATRKGLDLLRARMRQRAREKGDVTWEELPGAAARVEAAAERAELAEEMRRALLRLEPEEAEMFCLRHLEEMSYEEIGKAMAMSAGAVGVALHRIRGKLKGCLSGNGVTEQDEVRRE